jgi:hypothetical protein
MKNTVTATIYEVRPRKDKRGITLICDALPFGRLWYGEPNAVSNAIGYAEHRSRSYDAVIRVYDAAGNVHRDARAQGRFRGVKPLSLAPAEAVAERRSR